MANNTQLTFSFPHDTAFDEASFFVSDCNREARDWVIRWPDWPGNMLLLTGPQGAGKTHLAHIWRHRTDARLLSAAALDESFNPANIEGTRFVLDDADRVPHLPALFHLLNWLRENKSDLLLTATRPADAWSATLPDLHSRLIALNATALHMPDDALLTAVLTKLLADRQISVSPNVVTYLASHMERSFAAAGTLAARLDETALATRQSVNLSLARQIVQAEQE